MALALSPDGQTIARTKAAVECNRQNLAEREERLARLGKVVKDIQDAGGRVLPSSSVAKRSQVSLTQLITADFGTVNFRSRKKGHKKHVLKGIGRISNRRWSKHPSSTR